MGNTQSTEMAQAVREGIRMDAALEFQLFSNHYPPLPRGCLDLAKKAIRLWRSGFYKAVIDISEIGEHRRYGTKVPITECLEAWHLWEFVQDEDYDDDVFWIEYEDTEEVDGDKIYDRAIDYFSLLYQEELILEPDTERLIQIIIGYSGGYSDDPPGNLVGFGLVKNLEKATALWKLLNKEGQK